MSPGEYFYAYSIICRYSQTIHFIRGAWWKILALVKQVHDFHSCFSSIFQGGKPVLIDIFQGMIHPSMVSLLSQGYNLAHLGVPAPFFPFNPRQQQPQSMPRAPTSSAAAVNHHGVIKQSQSIQHLKTKNMTPHNK